MSNCNNSRDIVPVEVIISFDKKIYKIYNKNNVSNINNVENQVVNDEYKKIIHTFDKNRPMIFKDNVEDKNTHILHNFNCKNGLSTKDKEKLNVWRRIKTKSTENIKADLIQYKKRERYKFTFNDNSYIVNIKDMIENGLICIRYDCKDPPLDNMCANLDIDIIPLNNCSILKSECLLGNFRNKTVTLKIQKLTEGGKPLSVEIS